MTRNQIEYHRLQEYKRSNRATERETYRSNRAREAELQRSNLARERETKRSNEANELLNTLARQETIRSHRATEDLEHYRTREVKRANLENESIAKQKNALQMGSISLSYRNMLNSAQADRAREQLTFNTLQETKRSNNLQYVVNLARNNETTRANLQNESINRMNAQTRLFEAQTEQSKLLETSRHNKTMEQETRIHNRVSELADLIRASSMLTSNVSNFSKGGKTKQATGKPTMWQQFEKQMYDLLD